MKAPTKEHIRKFNKKLVILNSSGVLLELMLLEGSFQLFPLSLTLSWVESFGHIR